jgi:hypothetical protein
MTTNISELPSDPSMSISNENVKLETKNVSFKNNLDEKRQPGNISVEQNTMNKLVSGIQQASTTGSTKLPVRDVPTNTGHITQDDQINSNYIPQSESTNYIKNYETEREINNMNTRNLNKKDSLDVIYEELQVPILIGIIFFLFKLPIFEKTLFKYAPFLFVKDGNLNLYGFITTSFLFSSFYYILSKILKHFSNI